MVECSSLENYRAARYRGFESHPLRHLKTHLPAKRVDGFLNIEGKDLNAVRLVTSVSERRAPTKRSDSDNPTLFQELVNAPAIPGFRKWIQLSCICWDVWAILKKGRHLGAFGSLIGNICISAGKRLPLRVLQGKQEQTTFSHVFLPPLSRGTT